MYTICPGCARRFHINTEHIAAAAGQVRCGFCDRQFNVLKRLYGKSRLDISKIAIKKDRPKENRTSNRNRADAVKPGNRTNQPGAAPSLKKAEKSLKTETPHQNSLDKQIKNPGRTRQEFAELAILLTEEPTARGRGVSLVWTLSSLIVLLVGILQLAWFNRDLVLSNYPQLTPYARQICIKLNCSLVRRSDVSAIKLINRDIRSHPIYKDTLQLNATMKNEFPIRQPWPRVQLTLFDTSGNLSAYRVFQPGDYLDASIDLERGMPVALPVHFVLEISGLTAAAVSFEFRFL